MKQAINRAAIAALLSLIAACGGGSEDEPATTQPVDCNSNPALCR